DYPPVRGKHGVEDKVGSSQGAGLGHGLVDRVAVQVSGNGMLVLAACLSGVQHGKVAGHAGLATGDAWQDRLASAAETGKIVESDHAGQNQALCLDRPPVDAHINAVVCPADGHQLRRMVTVVVPYPDTSVKRAEDSL